MVINGHGNLTWLNTSDSLLMTWLVSHVFEDTDQHGASISTGLCCESKSPEDHCQHVRTQGIHALVEENEF